MLFKITVVTQVTEERAKRTATAFLVGKLSAILPPRQLPIVMPAKITPITAVHVYRDEPRWRAITLPATSSSTIIQKLEINTVVPGMKTDMKFLGLLIA
jgi:hypothetical protein